MIIRIILDNSQMFSCIMIIMIAENSRMLCMTCILIRERERRVIFLYKFYIPQ